jgi:uncharacterized membrane protein YecN with MAPEG domain
MRITGIYAALATLLVLILAIRVSLGRRARRVGIGDGGHQDLLQRIRVHANAIEHLPLALLLLLILELNQTQPLWLHVFGIALIVGRVLHAIGLSVGTTLNAPRGIGTGLTWFAMLGMALLLLWQWAVLGGLG